MSLHIDTDYFCPSCKIFFIPAKNATCPACQKNSFDAPDIFSAVLESLYYNKDVYDSYLPAIWGVFSHTDEILANYIFPAFAEHEANPTESIHDIAAKRLEKTNGYLKNHLRETVIALHEKIKMKEQRKKKYQIKMME